MVYGATANEAGESSYSAGFHFWGGYSYGKPDATDEPCFEGSIADAITEYVRRSQYVERFYPLWGDGPDDDFAIWTDAGDGWTFAEVMGEEL